DGGQVRPARHHLQRGAGRAQFLDPRRIPATLAAQDQQRLDPSARHAGVHQLDRDLGRASGEAAGDEMKDARTGGMHGRHHDAGRLQYRVPVPSTVRAMMALWLTAMCMAVVALWAWLRRPVESTPGAPHTILLPGAGPVAEDARIPRRLGSYWHSGDVPVVVQRCLANWRRLCPGWEINLVLGSELPRYVDPAALPAGFERLTPARRSDWLRLHLLARHGGVWIDASTILTGSLDWLVEAQAESRAEYLGFYLAGFCVPGRTPVIDRRPLAAPTGMPFVPAWAEEPERQLAT